MLPLSVVRKNAQFSIEMQFTKLRYRKYSAALIMTQKLESFTEKNCLTAEKFCIVH
jgi:hypothetical protein